MYNTPVPKGRKKIRDEKLAQKFDLNPLKLIAKGLALTGKPFYFLISNLTLILLLILSKLGQGTLVLINLITKTVKRPKKQKVKVKKVKVKKSLPKLSLPTFTFPKIKLPSFRTPNVSTFFKLEGLKINLLELQILSKLKKFSLRVKKLFSKVRFRFKFRIILPIFLLLFVFLLFYLLILKDLPSPKELTKREPEVSTKIYDRNGNLLYKIYKDKNRTILPLTQVPTHVRLATLAAEDAEFYSHPGFSIKGILRAIFQDIQNHSLQGGSTITQQLVKNVLLSPERTITRKIKEVVLSVEVEANYTKDQILEMYLNEVSYGGTAYGIEEGSESYFGKDVRDLNLAEAAFLAGLPKSPTLYSPFGQNPDFAFERQREILHLMVVNKFITTDQEEEALNERLTFVPNKTEIKAPHFVMYIRQLLVDKYGEDMVEKGGLEVTTSLDLKIEETAEKIVKDEVDKLKGLHVGNGAALVVSPTTGEILAMVGSKDYFDVKDDGNVNITTRLRQPGSSIKVVNYAYALGHGYTPASIINDSPITYITPGSPAYTPKNYDGQFRGNVTLRSALAESRNIPAIKVLASYGVPKMIEEGRQMGITTWEDSSQYGLSLTLGGGAVKALDLAKVYSVIANYGKRPDMLPILQIKDYKGHLLEKNSPQNYQVLDPRVAYSLIDILKDNYARSPEFGLNSSLVIKDHPEVAVKTGTSNDLRDNWTAGFNQDYLVLTWVGNNDNSSMSRIASGITGASPIWNKIMSAILADSPSIDWKTPDNLIRINCLGKGEWFLKESVPANYCKPTPTPTAIDINDKILDSGVRTSN